MRTPLPCVGITSLLCLLLSACAQGPSPMAGEEVPPAPMEVSLQRQDFRAKQSTLSLKGSISSTTAMKILGQISPLANLEISDSADQPAGVLLEFFSLNRLRSSITSSTSKP